ncbi:siderophore-interacting protein [Frankia sp. AgPm24]|uniref:siderophore-interacting protein n=1 Tax=Frankia sp. AgPm24 TaxID=631128 RepID=UPI00201063FF|nr:siderophore-interacting protein [Frankia sp. AgPm24]MCK9920721.1 siderophore-interacting protein [Frankia sp. AgPm24]
MAHETTARWYELVPRVLEVRRVARVTPRTARITLGGSDLAGFQQAAPGDHVKVCLPVPGGDGEPVLPVFGDDGMEPTPPDRPQPIMRDYTVRAHRPEAGELDLDFVLHVGGAAAQWAAAAAPGDRIGIVGPRGSLIVPFDYDWYLLGADETGLPALARWLESLPAGVPVTAFVEVADAEDEQKIDSVADVSLTWLHRAGVAPGRSDVLERAVRAFVPPAGDGFVWFAGEAGTLRPIRRHVRNELGIHPDHTDIDGYWKAGTVNLDHHEADPDVADGGAGA